MEMKAKTLYMLSLHQETLTLGQFGTIPDGNILKVTVTGMSRSI